jgi:hypothetical protein
MPIITRTPANFSVIVNRPINPVAHRAIVTAFAAAKLAEVQQINRAALGYAPKYTTTVDGQQGGSILGLKVDGGRAVFDFDLFGENVKNVVEAGLKALRDGSPVVSGAYRDGWTLYINDEPVANVPDMISPTDKIMLSNPVIYSRRIEVGKTISGRSFVMQVPDHLCERIAKNVLAPRFGNQVKITFGYVTLPDAGTVTGGMQAHTPRYGIGNGRTRKRRHTVGSQVQSPAIFIEALTA